jgi:hypothetical protein
VEVGVVEGGGGGVEGGGGGATAHHSCPHRLIATAPASQSITQKQTRYDNASDTHRNI